MKRLFAKEPDVINLPQEVWKIIFDFCDSHGKWSAPFKAWNEWAQKALWLRRRNCFSVGTRIDAAELTVLPHIKWPHDFVAMAHQLRQSLGLEASPEFCRGMQIIQSILASVRYSCKPIVHVPELSQVYLLLMLPSQEYVVLDIDVYKKLLLHQTGSPITRQDSVGSVLFLHTKSTLRSVSMVDVSLPTDWRVSFRKEHRENLVLSRRWWVFFHTSCGMDEILCYMGDKFKRDAAVAHARQLIIQSLHAK
jgi:hypothetical protein